MGDPIMNAEQFVYWLNGYAELTEEAPTQEQWKSIKEHLQTVFVKVTPAAPGTIPIPLPLLPNDGIPTGPTCFPRIPSKEAIC